jgi:hypothetical protein
MCDSMQNHVGCKKTSQKMRCMKLISGNLMFHMQEVFYCTKEQVAEMGFA